MANLFLGVFFWLDWLRERLFLPYILFFCPFPQTDKIKKQQQKLKTNKIPYNLGLK